MARWPPCWSSGTLKRGDVVLAGSTYGRVRAMLDENGKPTSKPALDPGRDPGPLDVPLATSSWCWPTSAAPVNRHLPSGQKLPRRQARQAAGRQAREHVRQHGQGRRRPCRSSSRPTCRARRKRWPFAAQAQHRRGQVQIIHAAVGGISESDVNLALASRPSSSASTSVPTPTPASWPKAMPWTCATTTSSTTRWTM